MCEQESVEEVIRVIPLQRPDELKVTVTLASNVNIDVSVRDAMLHGIAVGTKLPIIYDTETNVTQIDFSKLFY